MEAKRARKKPGKKPGKKPNRSAADKQRKNSDGRKRRLENLDAHKFKPGRSGNPKGRPKGKTLSELVRDAALEGTGSGKTPAELLVAALLKKATKGDLKAIREVFDRIEGKPRQQHEVSGTDGGPVEVLVRYVESE